MSPFPRTFTKEFAGSALRRFESGASAAEVARACVANPNVLFTRCRDLRK